MLAAICAFTLLLAAAPTASSDISLGAETGVAAQTDTSASLVGFGGPETPTAVGPNGAYGYDATSGCCVAPSATRFVVGANGNILDVAKISVPGPANSPYGKVDYLLGNVPGNADSVGKGGFFRGVLGFDEETLEPALRTQLIDNFSNTPLRSARQPHQVARLQVNAPIVGPSGVTANVNSVWEILPGGTTRFLTATPG